MNKLLKSLARRAAAVLLVLSATILAGTGTGNSTVSSNNHTTAQATPAALIPVLGSVTASANQVTPESYYRQVWTIINENFLYRDRLTNFAAWEHKYDGKLNTFGDAEKAINEMLDSLGDGYTFFRDASRTQTKVQTTSSTNVVSHRMLPGGIGYVKITTFSSDNTKSETEAALKALNKAGARGYIIDLRDNGGGYIAQSLAVFSMFVDKGEFATEKGFYKGKAYLNELRVTASALEEVENGSKTTSSRYANLTGKKPVAVLVNGNTASASEMLAGALRDSGRATIIGTQTYGKGIAQLNLDLPNSTSMQVTFAKLYQPHGGSIHSVGMKPDVVVSPKAGGDSQLNEAVDHVKKTLNP